MNFILENDYRSIVSSINHIDCDIYELGIRLRPYLDTTVQK